tara:strand:- start:177 stop:1082 length:906 start_codon:yes stop_codon:yes gene_type:complete
MKKIITLSLIGSFAFNVTFAQDGEVIKNKNGYAILPDSGDYAIQMDATPIMDFGLNAVNIMNNTGQTTQHPGHVSGFSQTIVGKYFISNKKALRFKVGINNDYSSTKTWGDNPLTPTAVNNGTAAGSLMLISTEKTRATDIFLGAGLEWRRGHNRLQGFYGAEAFLGFGSNSSKNIYEIEYNNVSQDSGFVSIGDSRILSNKDGLAVTFGVRGFVGVEYFVAPKISVGAEFGWGLGITNTPRGSVETEKWGIQPGSSSSDPSAYIETDNGNSSGRDINFLVDDGVNNSLGAAAAITATFHF